MKIELLNWLVKKGLAVKTKIADVEIPQIDDDGFQKGTYYGTKWKIRFAGKDWFYEEEKA